MGRGFEDSENRAPIPGLLRREVDINESLEKEDKAITILKGDFFLEKKAISAAQPITLNRSIKAKEEEKEDDQLFESEESFIKRTRAELAVRYPLQETIDELLEKKLQAFQREREREREGTSRSVDKNRLSNFSEEKALLEKEGITDFTPFRSGSDYWGPSFKQSPAYEALSNPLLYRKHYLLKIKAVDDPLLREEGQLFSFSISNPPEGYLVDAGQKSFSASGFAATEEEAKEKAKELINESVEKSLRDLRNDYNNFLLEKEAAIKKTKKEREEESAANEREFAENKQILKEREEKKELLAGLEHEGYYLVPAQHAGRRELGVRLFPFGSNADKEDNFPFLLDQEVSDIRRDSFAGFEIVSYSTFAGNRVAVFREGKLYAVTLDKYKTSGRYRSGLFTLPLDNDGVFPELEFKTGEEQELFEKSILSRTEEEDAIFQKKLESRVEKRLRREGRRYKTSGISNMFARISAKQEQKKNKKRERRHRLGQAIREEERLALEAEERDNFLERVKEVLKTQAKINTLSEMK
jgi:hypothetical protein